MITTIIFDLGKVLIHWDPRNLYRKIFTDEKEMEYFLNYICTPDWNEQQDAGRTWKEAVNLLSAEHPRYQKQIAAFAERWPEMLDGAIEGTVSILKNLQAKKQHRLYALTNWSSETFPVAQAQFDFLQIFEGILVSGEEKLKKPDPKIYQLCLDRFHIKAEEAIFIDDSARNVEAARTMGIYSILFESPEQLAADLKTLGIEVGER